MRQQEPSPRRKRETALNELIDDLSFISLDTAAARIIQRAIL